METQPQFSRRHYRRFYQLARRYWHDGRHSGLVWVSRRKCYQAAADRLGMPRILAMQMLFLYRYIFVLLDDGARGARALALRSCGNRPRLTTVASLLGFLLLRSWQRAEDVYTAMLARAYSGEIRCRKVYRFGAGEFFFVFGWLAVFCMLRAYDVTHLLGSLLLQYLP